MALPTTVADEPEDRFNNPHSVCSTRPRPQILTGFLRDLLGQHFGDPRNIEEPALRKLVWADSPAGTKAGNKTANILIETALQYVADMTDMRPAIIIKREGWQMPVVGLNNNELQGGNPKGFNTHVQICQGAHTLFCIAPGAAVEVLATEVYRELGQFAPRIRKELPHMLKFAVSGMGAPQPLTKSLKEFVVPIQLTYAFQDTFDLNPHVPRIKKIDFRPDINCPE